MNIFEKNLLELDEEMNEFDQEQELEEMYKKLDQSCKPV